MPGFCPSPSSFYGDSGLLVTGSPCLRAPGACLLPREKALGMSHLCSPGLSLLICIMAYCSQAIRRGQLSPQSLEFSLSNQRMHLFAWPSVINPCLPWYKNNVLEKLSVELLSIFPLSHQAKWELREEVSFFQSSGSTRGDSNQVT